MDNEELEKRLKWYEKRYGPYIDKRGLNKENIKNLFRWPTMQEWIVLILLLMALGLGWAYKHDINACQNALKEVEGLKIRPECIQNDSLFYPGGVGDEYRLTPST